MLRTGEDGSSPSPLRRALGLLNPKWATGKPGDKSEPYVPLGLEGLVGNEGFSPMMSMMYPDMDLVGNVGFGSVLDGVFDIDDAMTIYPDADGVYHLPDDYSMGPKTK